MKRGIDFLKAYKEPSLKEVKLLRFLKVGIFLFLICYCLLVGAAFSYWVYLRGENTRLGEQISLKKQRIGELRKIESLQIILKQRLSLLNKLFSKSKPNYSQLLTYLQQVSPEGIIFKEIRINEDGEVNISAKAPSALVLSRFLENLSSPSPSETSYFSEMTLLAGSRQKDGSYNFSFSLKKYGKPQKAS